MRQTRIPSSVGANALLVTALLYLTLLLLLPLTVVFVEALHKGLGAYLVALADPDTRSAVQLTLLVAAVTVPMNLVFGVAAAWAIAKFEFNGKSVLITLIDLPLAISPVLFGMVFVLLFGLHGWFGSWLAEHDLSIVFALPGTMLATMFVTFPYVARELIPLMQQLGNDEEEAAITLGAGGWMTFFKVTLPKIRWGLLYGVILCNARAMGEFGAVSVVSGHIRGLTTTMPLQVEIFYNGYISPLTQVIRRETLLPLQRASVLSEGEEDEGDDRGGERPRITVEYEPDPEEILKRLVPDYVEISIFRALLESTASEHGARMTAMRNASENAGVLIEDLTLQMNRARQAEITQEIMEVVAGAEGLT